eukprot:5391598-Amphidinium_carterae.1
MQKTSSLELESAEACRTRRLSTGTCSDVALSEQQGSAQQQDVEVSVLGQVMHLLTLAIPANGIWIGGPTQSWYARAINMHA